MRGQAVVTRSAARRLFWAIGLHPDWIKRDEKPPAHAGWRIAGDPPHEALRYIEIDTARAQDRHTYEAAANWLCRDHAHGRFCVIAFFLPGDHVPAKRWLDRSFGSTTRWVQCLGWLLQAARGLLDQAGWQRRVLGWDCVRAGEKDAPATDIVRAAIRA